MESWKKVCMYVSVFAILREIRPIDPFFIKYVTELPVKYTTQTIREEVYPIGSYVSVFFVVILFLITDYLRYKPIMVLNGLSGLIAYGLLLGSPSIIFLKLGQVFQMLFRASEIAYFTYMFAQIKDKDQYQIATSTLRTSVMIGKFCCGILSQILISYDILSYKYLLYISILGMVLTTIWALIMPSVQFSLYFYKNRGPVINSIIIDQKMIHSKIIESTKENPDKTIIKKHFKKMKCSEVLQKLWADFKESYSDTNVLKWSVWWSLSLCGYVMVSQYIQLQWQEIVDQEKDSKLINGAVESVAPLFSALAAYAIGIANEDWDKYGELIMAMVSLGLGVILYFLSISDSLTMAYIYYILFCCAYQTMLTISSAEVAKFLKRDCYALVFGFNKCIAYILINIFTVVVVKDTFFSLDIRQQFSIYGIYFGLLGCLFVIMASVSLRLLRTKDISLKEIEMQS